MGGIAGVIIINSWSSALTPIWHCIYTICNQLLLFCKICRKTFFQSLCLCKCYSLLWYIGYITYSHTLGFIFHFVHNILWGWFSADLCSYNMRCKSFPIAHPVWGSCRWDRQTDIEQDIVQCRLYVGWICCAGLDAGWQVTYSARSVCLWILSYMCTAQWCGHSRLRYGTGRHWHSPFHKMLMGTLQNQNNVTIHPMIDMGRHSSHKYWSFHWNYGQQQKWHI